jgi:hypothetical protein
MICPACCSTRLFPSRLRNALERFRQRMTEKQPYRCHDCGWRKWMEVRIHPDSPDVLPDDLRTGRRQGPVSPNELDQLDTPSSEPR